MDRTKKLVTVRFRNGEEGQECYGRCDVSRYGLHVNNLHEWPPCPRHWQAKLIQPVSGDIGLRTRFSQSMATSVCEPASARLWRHRSVNPLQPVYGGKRTLTRSPISSRVAVALGTGLHVTSLPDGQEQNTLDRRRP